MRPSSVVDGITVSCSALRGRLSSRVTMALPPGTADRRQD
jgi:hypothetical protein